MIFKNTGNLKYIFSTIKSSFLPALFLLCGLVIYYACNPYETGTPLFMHYIYLLITALTAALLYIANRSKPLFTLLTGCVCYIIINRLKNEYGESFISSAEFQCLCFALPLNIILLYFLPQSKLNTRRNVYVLLFLLFQATVLQHLCGFIKFIPHIDINIEAIPLWSCVIWALMLVPPIISVSFKNTLLNTGMFYADAALFMGMLYSQTPSGLTTFFLSFALILLCATVLDLYHRYHYDTLEHVGSKTCYLAHANTKFPFKYTIALFSIDNRDKLLQAVGAEKLQTLEQMIVNNILSMPYDLTLYRYSERELVMVFKNENAKHAKEFADNIRHNIAASMFIFSNGQNLKVTISVCVSEKTRKDRDVSEVTERAHNALQKGYSFNGNITTVA